MASLWCLKSNEEVDNNEKSGDYKLHTVYKVQEEQKASNCLGKLRKMSQD